MTHIGAKRAHSADGQSRLDLAETRVDVDPRAEVEWRQAGEFPKVRDRSACDVALSRCPTCRCLLEENGSRQSVAAAGRRRPYEALRSLSDLNVIEYRSCFTAGMECSHSRRAGPSST